MQYRKMILFAILAMCLVASRVDAQVDQVDTKQSDAQWTVPVLVLRYFPVTADKQTIDIEVTSNVGAPLKEIQAKCDRMTKQAMAALQQGSQFRAYHDANAPKSLKYVVVDTIEYLEAMPRNPNKKDKADYIAVLQRANIKKYIEEKGVKEVWIWGYHSKDLSPWESNMSSPLGDVSNSDRDPHDLPVFDRTYTVYHYNYERGTSEAVHNHIHQIEAVMRKHGGELWKTWEGVPGNWRCGNCHFPPNGLSDYDWTNKKYVDSDIEDWKPTGYGKMQRINCDKWEGDSLKWFVYWMRSMPGKNHGLELNGKPLTNWWVFMGDYDFAMRNRVGLVTQ